MTQKRHAFDDYEDILELVCDARKDAIEECALVAESYERQLLKQFCKGIAHAIRALKDKP